MKKDQIRKKQKEVEIFAREVQYLKKTKFWKDGLLTVTDKGLIKSHLKH